MYARFLKRPFDALVSFCLLAALSPVMALTALAILFSMGRPVNFRQVRPGRGGRPFTIYKFRTMTVPEKGAPDSDEARLTPLGSFLRRASLDELPQLVNVLRGEMSLVGPRPLLMEYLPRYSPRQARRHEVRPGITGWAQVNGRNALSWEARFELDVWYVENVSLLTDLRVLALTAKRLVRPSGISAAGHATMPPFMGSKEQHG